MITSYLFDVSIDFDLKIIKGHWVKKIIMFMEEPLSKEKIITYIIDKVEDLGFSVEKRRVLSFIDNFHEKFNRLPGDNEI